MRSKLYAQWYLLQIRSLLPRTWKQKKMVLSRVEQCVRDYVTEYPNIKYRGIVRRFGTPRQIAVSCVEEMGTDEVLHAMDVKKTLVRIVLAALALMVCIFLVSRIIICVDAHKDINGYGVIGEVEIISETVYEEGAN